MAGYITLHPTWALILCGIFAFLCIGFGVASLIAFKLKKFYIKPSLERDRLLIKPPERPAPVVIVVDDRKEEADKQDDQGKSKKKKTEKKKKDAPVNYVQRNMKEAIEAAEKKRQALLAAGAVTAKKKKVEKKPPPPPEPELTEEEKKARAEAEAKRKEEEERQAREALMKISFAGVTSAAEMEKRKKMKALMEEEEKKRAEAREEKKRKREEELRRREEALALAREEQKRQELEQEKQKQAELAKQKEEDRAIKRELKMAVEEGRDPDPDIVPAGVLLGLGYTVARESDEDISDDEALEKEPASSKLTEEEKATNLERTGSAYPKLPPIADNEDNEEEEESESESEESDEFETDTASELEELADSVHEGAVVQAGATVAATTDKPKVVKVKKAKKQKKKKKKAAAAAIKQATSGPGIAVPIARQQKLKKIKKSNKKGSNKLVIFGDEIEPDTTARNEALERERVENMKRINMGQGVHMYTDKSAAKKVRTLEEIADEQRKKDMFKRSKTLAQLDKETRERLTRFKTIALTTNIGKQKPRRMSEQEFAAAERQRIADMQAERFRQLGLGWTERVEN